jgi:prevent-host-death family protein
MASSEGRRTCLGFPRTVKDPTLLSAREVTLAELTRRTATVIRRVQEGEVAVVTRHHLPVAMLVPLADALELRPLDASDAQNLGALAARFRALDHKRHLDALYHGRWYGPRTPRPLEP